MCVSECSVLLQVVGKRNSEVWGRRLDGRFWDEYPDYVPRYSGKPVTVLVRNGSSTSESKV